MSNVTFSEAREAIVREVDRLSLDDMRMPGSRSLYPAEQILAIASRHLSEDVREYVRHANKLVRASLEAVIERRVRERQQGLYTRSRRRSR